MHSEAGLNLSLSPSLSLSIDIATSLHACTSMYAIHALRNQLICIPPAVIFGFILRTLRPISVASQSFLVVLLLLLLGN